MRTLLFFNEGGRFIDSMVYAKVYVYEVKTLNTDQNVLHTHFLTLHTL